MVTSVGKSLVGGGGVVLAENKATQPSFAGAWAEHGKIQTLT